MKVDLFPFQKTAVALLRQNCEVAKAIYRTMAKPQIISLTAPTGAGKTIIASALIENIYCGDHKYEPQPNAIVVWLSDSPQLNEQSKEKIERTCDKLHTQLITISEDSFDQEILTDGNIYFLNTQKLGKSSNLVKHSDTRQFTIWETLQNTISDKAEQLYFIIDEAHRGARGNDAGKANTIMQKFILGSKEDGLSPMPLVIGMSATSERFHALIANATNSTTNSVVVPPDDVRKSGLLKDIIKIDYPEDQLLNKDMAVLQAASDEWMDKCKHWHLYCQEQHYSFVNPIFLVQVANATKGNITATDLDDCLSKIEERLGIKFKAGEVVHAFGSPQSPITINNLDVPHIEPSQIESNRDIKVVFFKDTLSTGWDCPRAETMMSFRTANDATYIAQLLGRMIRTPKGMRILVDESLNEVHLFLPNFNRDNVEKVVKALQDAEGANIPTDISSETIGKHKTEVLTVVPKQKDDPVDTGKPTPPTDKSPTPNEGGATVDTGKPTPTPPTEKSPIPNEEGSTVDTGKPTSESPTGNSPTPNEGGSTVDTGKPTPEPPTDDNWQFDGNNAGDIPYDPIEPSKPKDVVVPQEQEPQLDRLEILNAINGKALLTYNVRTLKINNYFTSLFKMARLLSQSGLNSKARKDIIDEIVEKVHDQIVGLKANNQFDALVQKIKEFKLHTQTFDVFGKSVDDHIEQDLFSTTNTDIDRQYNHAEAILGNEGIGKAYGKKYFDVDDVYAYKLDVIIFANDAKCIDDLQDYAKVKYHELMDKYRVLIANLDASFKNDFDKISSDADEISKHNFTLPQSIVEIKDADGEEYRNHLYINADGFATIKLNGWEDKLIAEESKRPDFVCWLRNRPRKPWALCIPYSFDNENRKLYPDFIIIRKDAVNGYMVDILEPHGSTFNDNLAKAKGLANYAKENVNAARIQLIRLVGDKLIRLNLTSSLTREKVLKAISNEELDHIFDTDGKTE